jgi:hypothetical protein
MGPAALHLVKLYMQTGVLTGNIICPPGARLSDTLNGTSHTGPIEKERFLELAGVTIEHAGGREEKRGVSYINKATVQLVAILGDADSGKGLGAGGSIKAYPFVEKSPVPVRIETHDYLINGNMYRLSHQGVRQVLEDAPAFLVLNQVQVYTLANGTREVFPFAAVNKEYILSLQDESTS